MLFSDYFNIQTDGSETWFDPIMDDDTLLFVDPFLIYVTDSGIFQGGYNKIMSFFARIFDEAAKTPYVSSSPRMKVLTSRAVFTEPKEACLGYSVGSVAGAGSGGGFATSIINAVYDSINAGIKNLNHFEELGIFGSKIKEDRISDATINILKEEFILYTQEVCRNKGIPTKALPCRVYDNQLNRWRLKSYELPQNPYNSGPIILLPKKFLASINALNSEDFLNYCWEQFDDSVKDQLNVEIKSHIDKKRIVDIARNNPNWVNSYMTFKESQRNSTAYDLEGDPLGVYRWHKATEEFTKNNPISDIVNDEQTYLQFIDDIAAKFSSYIEDYEGYLMLIDESSKPKHERAAQLLLYGLIKHYCNSMNCKIHIKEPGKGIMTFKFGNGIERETLMEVKYARNSQLKRTFESFLSKVENGDQEIKGYYFILGFKHSELEKGYDLEEELLEKAAEYNFRIKYKVIDAGLTN